jgi:hypothetical protein
MAWQDLVKRIMAVYASLDADFKIESALIEKIC